MVNERRGYDQNFLGTSFSIPLPTFGLQIDDDVLKREGLRENYIVDYIHYSVVMSKSSKQALFSAANLDQKAFKQVSGRDWFVDPRIGNENQVGPAAYTKNPWDRGHLTRRTAVTWGSYHTAKRASNDSCSYANASMQHENFNQDEWRVPEQIVHYFKKDKNDRICVFTGPIFTETDRWYTRNNTSFGDAVRIPSGFWKIISYIDRDTNEIASQAYIMYQDANFIADKRGQHQLEASSYQVTITEVEQVTGLEFPEVLFESNPLFYYPRTGVNNGPEGFVIPINTTESELKKGVVFSREQAESEAFLSRKREFFN